MARLLAALTAVALVAALAPADALPADGSSASETAADRLVVRTAGDSRGAGLAAAVGGRVAHEIAGLDAVVLEVPSGAADAAAARLGARDDVADVERDAVAEAAQVTPDDLHWDLQWGLRQLTAPAAWEATTGDEAVTIAVLDTGVDAAHPDLAGAVAPGANFTDAGTSTDTDDRNGHGTRAAGIAAARTDNGIGIAGACWTCQILPVRVLDDQGNGPLSDVAAGMVWAVDNGADVLNLSLGSPTETDFVRDAVAYATSRGVPVVASAGNFGNAAGDPPSQSEVYPAAYDDAIGVAGNDEDGGRYSFSSFGDWVEVTAAGCNPATDLAGGYTWFCGTSASAPLVAGVLGLGLAFEPDASPEELAAAVTVTSIDAGYVEFGRVDAAATLEHLTQTVEPPDPSDPAPAPQPPSDPDDEEVTADPGLSLERAAGSNRFDTAARLSAGNVAAGGERAYLATGWTFPDALAAGAAAGRDGAPVLLVTRDRLPDETRDELARLDPNRMVVVGGTAAISSATAQAAGQAAGAGVHRIAGSDRFDTAARIARERFPGSVDTAFVATGAGFADALAGGPAAVSREAPVLLVTRDRLPGATRRALADLSPRRIEVLGGTAAVSPAVAAELAELAGDRGVRRHAGTNRFETAAAVSAAFFDPGVASVHLATGEDFPDALAGGPMAGVHGGPLLLVTRDRLPAVTGAELARLRPGANVVLGGWGVVSQEVEAAAGEASAAEE